MEAIRNDLSGNKGDKKNKMEIKKDEKSLKGSFSENILGYIIWTISLKITNVSLIAWCYIKK